MKNKSTFSIIGERYLDTQHDNVYIKKLEVELKCRKVTGVYRWFLEYLAASALWWNVVWWEWGGLDAKDVLLGWFLNFVFLIVPSLILAFFLGNKFGVMVFLVLHLLTIKLGFNLRSGTKEKT